MGSIFHLAKRFFGSLPSGGPPEADVVWVKDHLNDGEWGIWSAMSDPDQRHSVEVARAVEVALSASDRDQHERRLTITAALMHDSGKVISDLGTFARTGATLLRPMVSAAAMSRWSEGGGRKARLVSYWRHPELGADALERVDADPMVVAWARQHHRPAGTWTIPPDLAQILYDCDND